MRILGIASSDVHGGNGEIPQEDRYPAAFQRAQEAAANAEAGKQPAECAARRGRPGT